jgi:hypothetical protein
MKHLDLVEPTGQDTHVHARTNGPKTFKRVHPSVPANPGAMLRQALGLGHGAYPEPRQFSLLSGLSRRGVSTSHYSLSDTRNRQASLDPASEARIR